MNYALNDGITIVVDKGQGPGLVGDGQGELVVVHQADLLNLTGVVHVVQEDSDAKHFGPFCACYLYGAGTHFDVDFGVFVGKFQSVVEYF